MIVSLYATRPDFLELIFQLTLVKYEFGTPEKYSEDLEKFCVQADLVVNLGADKVTKDKPNLFHRDRQNSTEIFV